MIQDQPDHLRLTRTADDSASCLQALLALLWATLSTMSTTMRARMILKRQTFTWLCAPRFSSLLRMPRAWLAMIALVIFLPTTANAACGTLNVPDANTSPATSPMASGGMITITLGPLVIPLG